MRTRALAFVLATSVAATSVSLNVPRAEAQGMDADTKEAKSLFEEGVKLYKAGKYEEARVKFKAAYGLKKRPSIVLNLANSELQTKRYLDAIAHYKEVMSLPEAKQDDKDEAKTNLEQAKKQVGTVVIDAPTGTAVTVDGESKQVPVDGEIYLAPGPHTIVLKGAKETVEKANLSAGQSITVKPKSGAETAPPVTTPPTTTTPPTETTPPPTTTTPPPTETTPPPVETPPPHTEPTTETHRGFFDGVHPVTYVAAGVTVLAAVGWVGFYLNAKTHDDNAQKLADAIARPTCGSGVSGPCTSAANKTLYRQQGKDEISAGDRARTWSLISGITTGVAAAATVVTYIVLRKQPEKQQVAFIAAPLTGGAAFSLVGSF